MYWFKRKTYGWGWMPATWQGWICIFVFVVLVTLNFYRIDSASHSASDTLINFVPETAVLAAILVLICWKTGEKPGKRVFITGIPTAGKSYLAKKLAAETGGIVVSVDDMRSDLYKDPEYKKWIDFYHDKDEHAYYTSVPYDEQWNNLVSQSEGMWPGIMKKIRGYDGEEKPIIFEGVNILPHLAHKDLGVPGIVLIGKLEEDIFERCKEDPRWGKTEELWKLEADAFFKGERPRYRQEGEKYGYKVFESAEDAWQVAIDLLK